MMKMGRAFGQAGVGIEYRANFLTNPGTRDASTS
jgi:hypothetical protein